MQPPLQLGEGLVDLVVHDGAFVNADESASVGVHESRNARLVAAPDAESRVVTVTVLHRTPDDGLNGHGSSFRKVT